MIHNQGFHAAASLCATAQLHLAAAPTAFGILPEDVKGVDKFIL